ncbi:FAD-dependent monooxygenase [Pararhizobium sp. DWP1-1-3]|uniref:FAD-dependent monooxygenase n=1 Tax=Pararhizobium sp. DWP1-1-3 TaxID=2804652 RepID=UPI003CEE6676
MLPVDIQVLIVGAGPTGLALAARLQAAGVDHLLIDALEGPRNTSRAAVVHAHTLEMLETIDAASMMEAQALPVSHFTVRDRDQALLDLTFDSLPSHFRHLLMIPQSATEGLLAIRLGGVVHRGTAALAATATAGGATVRVKTKTGEQSIHARFVVAADGMRSVIREAAGIGFEGSTSGEPLILADVRMDWPFGTREVSMFLSPAGLVVVAPLPDGSFRVVATLDDAPEKPSIDDIQKLLDARGPAKNLRVTEIGWSSRFRVHHRLAETYRKGPFLLIGDAAHVHSPAGGQGMNTGLVDAIVLGEALTRVVRDHEPETLLDDYARIRRPAAADVLALAGRLTRIATVHSVPLRRLRNLVLRVLNHVPPFKRGLALSFSGLGRARYSLLPRD